MKKIINIYSDGMIDTEDDVTATAIESFETKDINCDIFTFTFEKYSKGCYFFTCKYVYRYKIPMIEEHNIDILHFVEYDSTFYLFENSKMNNVNTFFMELENKDVPAEKTKDFLLNNSFSFSSSDFAKIVVVNRKEMIQKVLA